MSDARAVPTSLDACVGLRVRRVDVPAPALVALSVDDGTLHGCVTIAAARAEVAWHDERPRGAPAQAFAQLLRKHLEGAVWASAELTSTELAIRFRRGPDVATLLAKSGRFGEVSLVIGERSLAKSSAPGVQRPFEFIATTTAPVTPTATLDERVKLGAALAKLEQRVTRRRAAVLGDLARADDAQRLRDEAHGLRSELARIERGATAITISIYGADGVESRDVTLDPELPIAEQIERRFARARKLERGRAFATERLARVDADLAELAGLRAALASSPVPDGVVDAARALVAPPIAGVARPSPDTAPARLPFRVHRSARGLEIRVGRSAKDNDLLTATARPHDLWLHARGVPGSHVVVRLAPGEVIDPESLVDAATLAAHHSDLRDETKVEVIYTPKKRVRKRRGMAPGQVEVLEERTIVVRVEPDRLARLARGALSSD